MKTLKQTFLVLIAIILFSSCSSDGNEISAPDDLHPTEWSNTVGGMTYTLYFSVDNKVYFSHPIGQEIEGNYEYNKPNIEFHFTGACSNSGFVFSSCDVSGSINGDTLTITDNGEDFKFYRKYD